jgi:hypothetical protein
MSRSTEDGQHEGWIMQLFADGYGGRGYSSEGIPVTHAPDGSPVVDRGHYRAEEEITGWQVACVAEGSGRIHWRGPVWTRTRTADDADTHYRFNDGHGFAEDSGAFGDAAMQDWYAHIRPFQALRQIEVITDEIAEAEHRRIEAVRQARAGGASWTDIGRAAHITRQSAHERWSKP